jgi:alcohol dehydrogenase class IV
MAVFRYSNPPVIHWGAGSLARLGDELQRLEAKRVAIVTTRSLLTASSMLAGDLLVAR